MTREQSIWTPQMTNADTLLQSHCWQLQLQDVRSSGLFCSIVGQFCPIPLSKLSTMSLWWTGNFKILHTFLKGFESEDRRGHASTFTFFFRNQFWVIVAVCLVVLSCWNVHHLRRFRFFTNETKFCSNKSRYVSPFMFPPMMCNAPVPFAEIQLHITMPPL